MLDFKPLQLEDLPKLRPFFGYSGSRICDTTPGTVFIWRDMYKTEWAIYDGSLYFKVLYPGLGETFTLPLGGGRWEHYTQIAAYCCRRNMPIAFYPVPKDELERLQEFFPNSAAGRAGQLRLPVPGGRPEILPGQKAQRPAQPCEQVPENLWELAVPPHRTGRRPPGEGLPGPLRQPVGQICRHLPRRHCQNPRGAGQLPGL